LNEAAKEGIIDYDFSTDTAVVNEEMLSYLESDDCRIESFTARYLDRIHPDDLNRVSEQFSAFLQQNHSIWQAGYRYRNRKGVYREVIGRGYLLRHPDTQKPLHIMYALQDITALKDANTKYYRQQMQHREQMTRSILTAQETERNRWAQELHDNVCQVLTAGKLYLEEAIREHGPTPMLAKSQAMMEKAINDIRQLSALIKPPEFSNTSLSESIENLLANLQRFSKAKFEIDLQPEIEERLREEQKVMVYRIVQEQ
jgi:signal transduction histidine kinase